MLSILAFALGVSVGSFVSVVADRVPEGLSLVSPRSYCNSCGRSLLRADMVPVLSYLWFRGRCRGCGAAISPRVLVVELATGLLFVAIYLTYEIEGDFAVLAVVVALMVAIAVIDLEHGLILNRIVFPSVVAALVLSPFWPELGFERGFPGVSGPLESALNSLVSGAGAFLTFWVVAIVFPRGMGGGDVKLSGLIGLLVGFPGVLIALWTAALCGGSWPSLSSRRA